MDNLEEIIIDYDEPNPNLTPESPTKKQTKKTNSGLINCGLLVSLILALTSGCSQPTTLESIKTKPQGRVGYYPMLSFPTHVLGKDLGKHRYSGLFEKNGMAYTLRGGHIDIAHLRKSVDWTAFLANKTLTAIMEEKTNFTFKLYEQSIYSLEITYPENWKSLSDKEKKHIARETAIDIG